MFARRGPPTVFGVASRGTSAGTGRRTGYGRYLSEGMFVQFIGRFGDTDGGADSP
jgi:hypothetical protein